MAKWGDPEYQTAALHTQGRGGEDGEEEKNGMTLDVKSPCGDNLHSIVHLST